MSAKVRIVDEQLLYQGRYRLTRTQAEVESADGHKLKLNHEVYRFGFAAATLLYDPDRRVVLLVRQFRMAPYLADGTTEMLEVCAGMLDEDDAETGARREVVEETGVEARDFVHAFDAFMSPGGMTERIACFTARYSPADRKGPGGGVDHDEKIDIVELDIEEALRLIGSGGIRDAKTIALLYHARVRGLV